MRDDIQQPIEPGRSRSMLAVVEARGFGADTAGLGVSQFAVGRQVRRLQPLPGRGPFRRGPKGVQRAPARWVES